MRVLRGNLCIRPANNSKVYSPKQNLFGGRSKKALRCSPCVHSANKSKAYNPKQTLFGAGAGLGPKRLLDAACHTVETSKVHSPKQGIG